MIILYQVRDGRNENTIPPGDHLKGEVKENLPQRDIPKVKKPDATHKKYEKYYLPGMKTTTSPRSISKATVGVLSIERYNRVRTVVAVCLETNHEVSMAQVKTGTHHSLEYEFSVKDDRRLKSLQILLYLSLRDRDYIPKSMLLTFQTEICSKAHKKLEYLRVYKVIQILY